MVLLAGVAGVLAGITAAVATLGLLPLAAVAGLLAFERESAVVDAVRAWWLLRQTRRITRERLRRSRSELAEVLDEVYEWLAGEASRRDARPGPRSPGAIV
jgi:hypothetical protein